MLSSSRLNCTFWEHESLKFCNSLREVLNLKANTQVTLVFIASTGRDKMHILNNSFGDTRYNKLKAFGKTILAWRKCKIVKDCLCGKEYGPYGPEDARTFNLYVGGDTKVNYMTLFSSCSRREVSIQVEFPVEQYGKTWGVILC